MAHDIFISYSRKDSAIVDRIEKELGKYGITYFIDKAVINAGDKFAKKITKALYESEVVLFVWSDNSNNSDWTAREIMLALKYDKIIVPFKIGTFSYSDLDLYLSDIDSIITETFNEPAVIELGEKIAKIFGKQDSAGKSATVYAKEELKPKVDVNKSVSVQIGNLIIADRNLGATEDGSALNYTNDKEHPDYKNSSFKGRYYTWEEAKNACPHGWRLPTKDEVELIESKMKFSDGKAYLESSSGNRCYFPLSGDSSYPSSVNGYYWSSSENENFETYAWYLSVDTSLSYVGYAYESNGFSVRCVKTAL